MNPDYSGDTSLFSTDTSGQIVVSELASGPFVGMQGGMVATLLSNACRNALPDEYVPISHHTEFLQPAPIGSYLTAVQVKRRGKRVASVHAALVHTANSNEVACAQMTLSTPADLSVLKNQPAEAWGGSDAPEKLASVPAPSPHGRPWVMDVLDGKISAQGIFWFKWKIPLFDQAENHWFDSILSAADWIPGIGRPGFPAPAPISAWPNNNLSVHADRTLVGEWVGIRPKATWHPDGRALAYSELLDENGVFGLAVTSSSLLA